MIQMTWQGAFNNTKMTIHTLVSDPGDANNETSVRAAYRWGNAFLSWSTCFSDKVAAGISIVEDSVIDAVEDTQLDLGAALNGILSFTGRDDSPDQVGSDHWWYPGHWCYYIIPD